MSGRRVAALLAVAIIGATGCGARQPSGSPAAAPRTPGPSAALGAPGMQPFGLGLEYGVPGLAGAYAATGITRIKPALEFGVWGNLEPSRGKRDFRPLDTLVHEYQQAGFRDVQLLISAESPWASRGGKTDPMPRDGALADYASFVAAFVERYDGDGQGDAPGLLYPVHEYGVERELSKFWASSAADYVRLLGVAAPAIRAADPQARILMNAILAVDVFDGLPSAATVETRWRTNEPFRKSRADIVTVLAACDLYDDVDLHSLGDATELAPTVAWIRDRLREAGCPDRPVWVGDAFPASALVAYNNRPIHPTADAQRAAVTALLGAAVDRGDKAHDLALAWVREQVARGLVRKAALAIAARASGINLGNLEDWTTGLAPADRLFAAGAGTSVLSGHLDTTITNQRPGGGLPYDGDGFSRARTAGAQRPSFAALTLLTQAFQGVADGSRVTTADSQAWVIQLVPQDGSGVRYIAWLDDGALDLPGAAPLARDVTFQLAAPTPGGGLRATAFPTTSTTVANPTAVTVSGDAASVRLTRTPVLVEPVR